MDAYIEIEKWISKKKNHIFQKKKKWEFQLLKILSSIAFNLIEHFATSNLIGKIVQYSCRSSCSCFGEHRQLLLTRKLVI